MSRLIDADALLRELKEHYNKFQIQKQMDVKSIRRGNRRMEQEDHK